MREQYISRQFIEKSLDELSTLCPNENARAFVANRRILIRTMATLEQRKFLFFETIAMANKPELWKS